MSNGSQMHSAVATCPNAYPKNQGQCAYVSPCIVPLYSLSGGYSKCQNAEFLALPGFYGHQN